MPILEKLEDLESYTFFLKWPQEKSLLLWVLSLLNLCVPWHLGTVLKWVLLSSLGSGVLYQTNWGLEQS